MLPSDCLGEMYKLYSLLNQPFGICLHQLPKGVFLFLYLLDISSHIFTSVDITGGIYAHNIISISS